MTTVALGPLSAALRRGVLAGWWLACPACGGTGVGWRECAPGAAVQWSGTRLACTCGWVSATGRAADLVRMKRDDKAGRFG